MAGPKRAPAAASAHPPRPTGPETLLGQLRRLGQLDTGEYRAAETEIRRGASEVYAVALLGQQERRWTALNQDVSPDPATNPLISDIRQMGTFETPLISHQVSLETGLMPWREVRRRIDVLTYHPQWLNPDLYRNLAAERRIGEVRLCTPRLWRELYAISRPMARKSAWPDQEHAAALVGYFRLGTDTPTLTPEAQGEAVGLSQGLTFVHPKLDPAQVEAVALMNIGLMLEYKVFPHHLEGSRLMVMTDAQQVMSGTQLYNLERFLGREIGLLLSTRELIEWSVNQFLRQSASSSGIASLDALDALGALDDTLGGS